MNNYRTALLSSNPLLSVTSVLLGGLSLFSWEIQKLFSPPDFLGASAMILQTGFSLPTTTTTTTFLSPCSPHRLNTLFFTHRRRRLVSPSCFSKRRFSLCGTFLRYSPRKSKPLSLFNSNSSSSSSSSSLQLLLLQEVMSLLLLRHPRALILPLRRKYTNGKKLSADLFGVF